METSRRGFLSIGGALLAAAVPLMGASSGTSIDQQVNAAQVPIPYSGSELSARGGRLIRLTYSASTLTCAYLPSGTFDYWDIKAVKGTNGHWIVLYYGGRQGGWIVDEGFMTAEDAVACAVDRIQISMRGEFRNV